MLQCGKEYFSCCKENCCGSKENYCGGKENYCGCGKEGFSQYRKPYWWTRKNRYSGSGSVSFDQLDNTKKPVVFDPPYHL